MDEYTNYLVHHGIQGQRWGIRRFQNADGSLTSAGRSKYGVGPKRDKKKARAEKKAAKKRAKAALEKAKQIQKEKAARDRRMKTGPGAASEAVKMNEKDIKKLTEQYRNANAYMKERSQLDEYIDKYSPKEPTKFEKVVNVASKAASLAESTKKVYDAYNAMFGNKHGDSTAGKSAFGLLSDSEKNHVEMNMDRARKLVRNMSDVELDDAIKRTENEQKLVNVMLGKDDKIYKKK